MNIFKKPEPYLFGFWLILTFLLFLLETPLVMLPAFFTGVRLFDTIRLIKEGE